MLQELNKMLGFMENYGEFFTNSLLFLGCGYTIIGLLIY